MTTRTRNLVILASLAAVALAAAVLAPPSLTRRSALDAAPSSSFLVITVDADALRASALADVVSSAAGGAIPGAKALSSACGWDVLSRVSELAVAVPEQGNTGEFGIAARGNVTRDELKICSDHVMADRGGKAKLTTRGRFVVLEDEATAASEKGPGAPKIAFGEGGPLLVARGAWLDDMMDTADGKRPSVRGSEEHTTLRAAVTPPHRKPTLVASAILPKALRDRLRREMGADDPEAAVEAKAGRGSGGGGGGGMSGVLAVASVGLSLTLGKGDEASEVAAELRCESASACADVKTLIERMRLQWSQDFRLRIVGLGPLIDSLAVTPSDHAAALRVTAQMPSNDLARVATRLLELRGGSAAGGRRPAPAEPAASMSASTPAQLLPKRVDEVIQPASDAGPAGAARKAP